ncbi:MAG: hypothetical protein JST86_02245 [Bacteroidetes bacterium]|nr:hypothetical protein [Bacteroidota bacterium]
MFTVADFVSTYNNYSDEELYIIYNNPDKYSAEGNEAARIVIDNKGGVDQLVERLREKAAVNKEIKRIQKETKEMGSSGIDSAFIKTVTQSAILNTDEVNSIIDHQYTKVEAALENKKIKPRTIVGSVVGGFIAAVIGGVLWGLQMIYSHRIFYLFFAGLALLCYGIIKFATRQDKTNIVVFIATVISVMLALLIGEFLYSMIGYIE